MADRKYTIARPIQDVRLRKWKPNNVAQFKQVVETLETELNVTMAAQVAQGAKRVISRRVPKIVGVTLRSGFKNFQISYNPAKGLKDLLFYEIQKSTVANFAENTITTYTIPQTSLTIAATIELQEIFFRVRAINSKFEAGPWSATVTTTARSFFRLASFDTGNLAEEPATVTDITPAQFNTWVDVGGTTYSPSVADVCFLIHAGVQASCINHFVAGNGVAKTITNDASVVIRITRAGVPLREQLNVRAWGYQDRTGDVPSVFTRKEHMNIGSMVTGFESYDGTGPIIAYRVQAKVLSETCSSDLTSGVLTTRTYNDNVRIILSCTTIFEIIQTS